MSDDNPFEPDPAPPQASLDTSAPGPSTSPAVQKFLTCRWHKAADGTSAAYCTHRDVLSMAGTAGFNADAWCTDCPYFKVKRVTRKPPYV